MTHPVLSRLLLATVLLFLSALPPVNARSSTPETPPQMRPPPGEGGVEPAGIGGRVLTIASERMETAAERLSEIGQGLLSLPGFLQDLPAKARDPETRARWGEMAGKVILVLLVALLCEWLVRRLLRRFRRSIEDRDADRFSFRVLFLFARTALDILPVAAFATAAYGILPLTDPRLETRLIALALVNASVLARILLAVSRMVLVPGVPALRLSPVSEETVQYLYIWTRRMVGLGVYGYFILEAALLMGMPGGLHVVLLKMLGLSISTMLVVLVLQNKHDVAARLRRDPIGPAEERERDDARAAAQAPDPGLRAAGALRRRLAAFWHVAAIVLIIGSFLTWALEVEGAMAFLLTGLSLTLVVMALAGALVRLTHRGVDRLFHVREELKTEFPGLEVRVNRYQPFVRNVLKGAVYLVAFFSILQVWGLGALGWVFSPVGVKILGELLTLLLIIGGAFLLWEIASAMIERSLAQEAKAGLGSTRKRTLLPLLRTVVRIALVVMASMLALSQVGINIAPLLAGAGIIGLAVGFGAQTLVRDVITGAFILLEDALSVGDWVEAGGHSGIVERLTVRTVTLRDIAGTVRVVPFGDVTTVTNYNRDYGYALIDAGVAYRESYAEVVLALQDVAVELRRDDTWGPDIIGDLEVFGMNNLGDSAVEVRVRLKTRPMRQFAVRRAFLERMKRVFDERGIEIPFPHRTIWFGTDKDGTAPPMHLAQPGRKALEPSGQKAAREPSVQMASESGTAQPVEPVREQPTPPGKPKPGVT